MLANFFGKSKPITLLVLSFLFLSYFFIAFFSTFSFVFITEASFISYLRFTLILFVTLFIFNFIIVKNNLTFDNSYAFMFYVICLGLIPESFLNEKTLLINLILLLFLRKMYSFQTHKKIIKKLFDAGLWLGIGFLLEPFLAIFMLLLYIAVYIHQKITIRTLIIPIVGFIVPLFLYISYNFWCDSMDNFYNLFNWFTTYDLNEYNVTKYLFCFFLIGLFMLFSIVTKTPKTLSISNTFRKSWILVLLNLLVVLFLILIVKNRDGSELIYLFFPTSVILANGLELLKKDIFKDLIITFFLLSSICVNFL